MTGNWLHRTLLSAASLLVPGQQREEWLVEWHTELWYLPRGSATKFCLGSLPDAFWVRWNQPRQRGLRMESPLACVGLLAVLAASGILIAPLLLEPLRLTTKYWRLSIADVPAGCVVTFALSCVLLLVSSPREDRHYPLSWPNRARRLLFLVVKVALLQPALFCSLLLWVWVAPSAPFAWLAIFAAWIASLRWAVQDQHRRCPVCLRLLSEPVRIGSSSSTFLEWHGAESMCSQGHGLLHEPQTSAGDSRNSQWLSLDDSWRGLFDAPRGGHRP